MIRPLSLPLIIASCISMIFGIFTILLHFRLKSRYQEEAKYYIIFSQLALVSSLFLGAFSVFLNSSENLDYLDIANRVTIISAMFTLLLGLQFYISFFNFKKPILLKWIFVINVLFSLLCLAPNRYFLAKEFYPTSSYYTGLAFGPLFQLWGVWLLIVSTYSIIIIFRVYMRHSRNRGTQSMGTVRLLIGAASVWMITGLSDALTGIQVIDLPPLNWVGSFLLMCCIAWTLALHINNLYEERHLLSHRLMYDHLTEAFSRSYFEVRLAEAIKLLKRGDMTGLYVCMFDVDDFKTVNDHYGHAAGDRVLKEIASITRTPLRPSDCSARFGGDEFALLLTGTHDETLAIKIVERIRNSILEARFGVSPDVFRISCSFGLVRVGTEHLESEDLPDKLLACADQALYVSKRKGKNTVSVSTLPVSESETGHFSRID